MTETEPNTEALAVQEPAPLPTFPGEGGRHTSLADIAQHAPQAIEAVVNAMAQATTIINRAAFGLTRPEDWVLNRSKEGEVTALLGEGAARRVASLIGLRVNAYFGPDGQNVTEPVVVVNERGEKSAVIIAQFDCLRLGMEGMLVRAERSETEQFTGRKGNLGDLKSATMSLAIKKAVHAATGITKAPLRILEEAGIDIALCRKGHGYGSSDERRTAAPVQRQATHPEGRPPVPVVEPVAAPDEQAGPPEDRADVPVIPFGKNKGTPIDRLSDRSLQWYIEAAEQNINDPAKARYRDKEAVWLTQLTREMARRNV